MSKKPKEVRPSSGFEAAVDKYIANYTLADHPELIAGIFAARGLEGYYQFFVEHGTRAFPKGKVYHGRTHSFQVALNCYEGGLYNHLTSGELKTLMVAGLYHDAMHSQGDDNDGANIQRAVQCLQTAHGFTPEHQRLKPLELDAAVEAIRLTEYPYKAKNIKSTLARILRDADMMSLYCEDPDVLLDMFLGLIEEQNVLRRHAWDGKLLSVAAFREQQASFCTKQGQAWYTSWAKLKAYHRNWPGAWRRLDHLLSLSTHRVE